MGNQKYNLQNFKTLDKKSAETVKLQEQLIRVYEVQIKKLETENKTLRELHSKQQQLINEINQKFENMQKIIHNQDQMIEILIAENQSLGGEISKDLD